MSFKIECSPKVFEDAPQILKEASRLLRVTQLYCILPSGNRLKFAQQLEGVWKLGLSQSMQVDQAVATLMEGLGKMKNMVWKTFPESGICKAYIAALKEADTSEKLQKCIRRFWKDAKSVAAAPMQKSCYGGRGPTLIVGYPRFTETFAPKGMRNYVMKWTDWNELCGNNIYQELSTSDFFVPRMAGIDLEAKSHEKSDRTRVSLSAEETDALEQEFLALTKAVSTEPASSRQMMFLEYISGANLFDFARTDYGTLDLEQKKTLFRAMGKVTLLDLLVGNHDRFLALDFDREKKSYELLETPGGANLGNLMVVVGEDSPLQSYAIDNSIEPGLIANEDHKEAYLEFLKRLCTQGMEEALAKHMVESIKAGIPGCIEVLGEKRKGDKTFDAKSLKESLKEGFMRDLDKFGKEAFSQGIKEMSDKLQKTLIPHWNGEEGEALKQSLTLHHPELPQAITERFQVFLTARSS